MCGCVWCVCIEESTFIFLVMEFAELIQTPKLDGVILHSPLTEPVDGTLCITGHHLILSSRREGVQELWVSTPKNANKKKITFPSNARDSSCYCKQSIGSNENQLYKITSYKVAC